MIDLVLFDYTKAFDTVCHDILLEKLDNIGICAQLKAWIQQFLMARRMQVRVSGIVSEWHDVNSGVPQGSVLGPILFLIYVNHVVHNIRSKYKIFADDLKLYLGGTPSDGLLGIDDLQEDINTLTATSQSWGLIMNTDKCACLRLGPRTLTNCSTGASPYSINGESIKYLSVQSDLGIITDRKLKFHEHIRSTANKCNGITTNIMSSTLCRSADFLITAYKTLIQPKLEYGSATWNLGYRGDLKRLERVQRRWTRQVDGLRELPYNERLQQLNLFSVQGRLLRADMILTWKILSGKCALQAANIFQLDNSTRRGHSKKLYLPRTRLEVRRRFFSVRVVQDWNSLSEEAVSSQTLNQFKSFLHRDLGQRLFEYAE